MFDFLKKRKGSQSESFHQTSTGAAPLMKKYVGYKSSATGVFSHDFCDEANNEVCSISGLVVPHTDVIIHGYGKTFSCKKLDWDITRVPGVKRFITDEKEHCVGYYEYVDINQMRFYLGKEKILITISEDGWRFSVKTENDAQIIRIPEWNRIKGFKNGYDTEKRFTVEVSDDIELKWYPFIFATPMLGF